MWSSLSRLSRDTMELFPAWKKETLIAPFCNISGIFPVSHMYYTFRLLQQAGHELMTS